MSFETIIQSRHITPSDFGVLFLRFGIIEILKGEKTARQLAGELEVHPLVLSDWKRHFLEIGAQIFERP